MLEKVAKNQHFLTKIKHIGTLIAHTNIPVKRFNYAERTLTFKALSLQVTLSPVWLKWSIIGSLLLEKLLVTQDYI